jgi:hypothetical protein
MIFFIITTLVLTGVCTYLGYRVWFLAGAVADLQEQDEDVTQYIQSLEMTNLYMYDKIMESYMKMQEIDTKGAFAAEDEVGTTFDMLKQVIEELKEEFTNGQEETK